MQWLRKLDLSSNGDDVSFLLNMPTHMFTHTHIRTHAHTHAHTHVLAGDIRSAGAAVLSKALKKMPNLELLNLSGK